MNIYLYAAYIYAASFFKCCLVRTPLSFDPIGRLGMFHLHAAILGLFPYTCKWKKILGQIQFGNWPNWIHTSVHSTRINGKRLSLIITSDSSTAGKSSVL